MTTTLTWLAALVRRQPARLAGAAAAVAVAVAVLATLGTFLAHANATMSSRAASSVAVDWQVQVAPHTAPGAVDTVLGRTPGVVARDRVGFAATTGYSSVAGGTQQHTGPGVLLGLPADYRASFPGELRALTGSADGVLIAQQTAANLHAGPGSVVGIGLAGRPTARVRVAGVVDLPQANSLFQKVGAPAGAQPSAPPDNVLLVPLPTWQQLTAPLAASRPDLVTTQFHVRIDHHLPADPAAAYTVATGAAHNVEAQSSGSAVVGNNLAAALDSARSDAAYAQILFGFLGAPAAVLAGLLTAIVAAASGPRRRREQALLRLRGASRRQLVALAAGEAAAIGLTGCAVGLGVAALTGRLAFGSAALGASAASAVLWAAIAVGAGVVITTAAILLPMLRDLRASTVAAGRHDVVTRRYPWWAKYGLDVAALIGAGLIVNAASGNGYQLVLAPEGVPTISVSYWALAGPALLWLGAGLFVWRLVDLLLGRGRRITGALLRPFAGAAARPLGNSIARSRPTLVKATVLLALTIAFAISTATFNATYRAQAEADAKLTNGADVTVTESPGTSVPAGYARTLAAIPGVHHVEPLQHRFAYVGSDLQDLYGVNPATIRSATALQDSYFQAGGTAAQLMATLRSRPDSLLVSAETVADYQLHLGDRINLRLVDARTNRQVSVPFHYVGVVAEFPTAPKDSFFIANSSYVATSTGSAAVGSFLIDTGGGDPAAVARRVRAAVGTSATVTDITSVRSTIGSSLTAVDLSGLTRIELAFALVLAAASAGVVLALGFAERRRNLAVLSALGARRRHLRTAVAGESGLFTACGVAAGAALGIVLTQLLVAVLTGVFDPPPSVITVPWTYLAGVVGLVLAGVALATVTGIRLAGRHVLREING